MLRVNKESKTSSSPPSDRGVKFATEHSEVSSHSLSPTYRSSPDDDLRSTASKDSVKTEYRSVAAHREEMRQIISALKQELHLRPSEILYSVDDSPPIYLVFLLAVQVIQVDL